MCLVHLESIKYETIYNHKPQNPNKTTILFLSKQ